MTLDWTTGKNWVSGRIIDIYIIISMLYRYYYVCCILCSNIYKNRILTYCATHRWKISLPIIIILFQIPRLAPVTHSSVRQAIDNNTNTLICASTSVDACTAIIFYQPPLIFFVSNTVSQLHSGKNNKFHNHKAQNLIDTSDLDVLTPIPFEPNCKVDQRNGRINLKFMVAIVSIEILLPFTLTNKIFGNR